MSRVLLVGSGSVGTTYLYILSQAHADVTAVCRSNYDVVKRDGFTLNSRKYGNDINIRPNIVRSVADAQGPFDFLFVATKCYPGTNQPAIIAPAVSRQTTIVLLQNGIGIEEDYRIAFPHNPLLSCVVYISTSQTGPSTYSHGPLERLEIGAYPSTASRAPADSLAKLLKSGGGDPVVYDDVQVKRWSKSLLNAVWNPICALSRCWDVQFMESTPFALEFVYEAVLELVAVAQACGHSDITEADAKYQIEWAKSRIGTDGYQTSMLADVLADRPLETDAVLGNIVKLAKEKSVSVPRLETLNVLIKAYDARAEKRRLDV